MWVTTTKKAEHNIKFYIFKEALIKSMLLFSNGL